MMPGVDKVTAFCCAFVRAAVTARKAFIMPRSKSRKTKNPLLLEARILGAFNDQPMLHLDDIAAIAIQCDPMPTLKKVKTLLDKLVEEGWLRALPDLWFSRVTSSINSSSLTFDHNDY